MEKRISWLKDAGDEAMRRLLRILISLTQANRDYVFNLESSRELPFSGLSRPLQVSVLALALA